MNNSPIKAIGGSMIVEQYPEENVNKFGIIVKDTRTYRYGVVLSVGSDVKYYKEGDVVMYAKEAAYPITLNDGTPDEHTYYRIETEEDVYCKRIQ